MNQSSFLVQLIPTTIDLTLPSNASGILELTPTIKTTDTISHMLFFVDGVLTGNASGAPFVYALDSTTIPDDQHTLNTTTVMSSGLEWFKEFSLQTLNNLGGRPLSAENLQI